ncbi:MAG: thiolase family protein [Gammaproteobacteria bacterium]|nr:thiolase family protein [Gammaproteobacteria bacterium]
MKTSPAPASVYRAAEGLGLWEHRGKVAAVGVGHSPTFRRWDGTPANSVGGISLEALRRAIDDAGVDPADIDGLVMDPSTTTGAFWPKGKPLPWEAINAYNRTDDPLDGITGLSAEWILANMPQLNRIEFTTYGVGCMSNAICVAAQAIGNGRAHTCLVLKSWHNLEGRYYQGGANAGNAIPGSSAIRSLWGTPACFGTAVQFAEYCRKYGKSHDMMAPFIENSRKNGLKFPEGYWAQHRPEEITPEDYEAARWIAKPANLFDNDMPIMVSAAYLFTTAERARHLKQKPVYILNHATSRTRPRSLTPTLDEVEEDTARTARKIYEGAGITADDLSFENMYDGFALFHQFHIEGLGYRGLKFGEALDFYQTDISISGPNPVSPSGGNIGCGRSRFWMHTDCIQQLQHRAGARQVTGVKPEIAVSGGPMPVGGNYMVWSATPD